LELFLLHCLPWPKLGQGISIGFEWVKFPVTRQNLRQIGDKRTNPETFFPHSIHMVTSYGHA
jgi:hypothetical protein